GSGSDSEGVHNGKEKDQMVKAALLWILLSVTAAVGYYIKPQTIIAYIAIAVYFAFDAGMGALRRRILFLGTGLLSLVLMLFLTKAALIPSIGIETDDERSFGMAHYFMMGLNDETDGVYSDEDTLYTDAFETPEEKRRADMELAGDRIKAYGPAGLIEHLKNKTLVNYNDGLFAWGIDGNFFGGRDYEDLGSVPDMSFTEWIWSFIRPDGADHGKYSSAQQTIWITVLLLGLIFACFALRDLFIKNTPSGGTTASCGSGMAYIVMLALAGLFVFELLFEAKARYLFIYIPYYLILSVYGTAYLSGGAKWER
nr:hypothetical protein [Lachnospiraceae bacterium]